MNPSSTIYSGALSLFLSCAALAQSSFQLRNYSSINGVDAAVFDAQGVPLAGPNYLAELWGAATPDSLTPLLEISRGSRREIVPFGAGGYFFSDVAFLSVPTVAPYGWAWLELRAWDARLGATYEEVAALGIGGYGESPLFYAQGGNPLDLLSPVPAPLIGLQSFSLREIVPEPGSIVLLGLGLLVMVGCQRRR